MLGSTIFKRVKFLQKRTMGLLAPRGCLSITTQTDVVSILLRQKHAGNYIKCWWPVSGTRLLDKKGTSISSDTSIRRVNNKKKRGIFKGKISSCSSRSLNSNNTNSSNSSLNRSSRNISNNRCSTTTSTELGQYCHW